MWFRLVLPHHYHAPLAALVGQDEIVYWRISDLLRLLKISSHHPHSCQVVLGKEVVKGPASIADVMLCNTFNALQWLGQDNREIASLFQKALQQGLCTVIGYALVDTYEKSPLLIMDGMNSWRDPNVPLQTTGRKDAFIWEWIRDFKQRVANYRQSQDPVWILKKQKEEEGQRLQAEEQNILRQLYIKQEKKKKEERMRLLTEEHIRLRQLYMKEKGMDLKLADNSCKSAIDSLKPVAYYLKPDRLKSANSPELIVDNPVDQNLKMIDDESDFDLSAEIDILCAIDKYKLKEEIGLKQKQPDWAQEYFRICYG